MRKLSEALGQDRWVQIQRSTLKEQIRNCRVEDVTIGDVVFISDLFRQSVIEIVEIILEKDMLVDRSYPNPKILGDEGQDYQLNN